MTPASAVPPHDDIEHPATSPSHQPSSGLLPALGIAATVAGALASAIVLGTWFQEGTASAMRAATECVMPLGLLWWITGTLALAFYLRGCRKLAAALVVCWVALWSLGSGLLAGAMMGAIEWPRDSAARAPATPFRCVVVLGGGLRIAPDGAPEVGADGQRVMLGAQMWHAGQTRAIVCTGTSSNDLKDPSVAGRELLASVGVPSEVLFGISGRNTVEEMKSLRQFLDAPPEGFPAEGDLGLITSAFHMQRAMRLARSQGIELVPLPCSYRVGPPAPVVVADLIPRAGAAELLALACKESLARLLGR